MIDFNSFLLIAAAGLALIGGIVFRLYYNRIFSFPYKVKKNDGNQSQNSRDKKEEDGEEGKTQPNLLKRNFELLEDEIKIYQFEKELVSHAIENILLASKNKSIDIFEKDRLLLKYNDQLKKINEKMDKIQSEIDVTKLIDLRNDLASLLDNKISDIDKKIKEINFKIETKSKIRETKNQNKKNSNINSQFDIEEITDANLKSRNIINYKINNNTNKNKETIIEAERKKIIDLKDQVSAALNRLDRARSIKEEIKDNEVAMIHSSQIKKDLVEEDNKDSLKKTHDFNDKDQRNQVVVEVVENKISPKISINEKKVSVPKIFNSIMRFQSKNDTLTPTTKLISNPPLKNMNQGIITKNYDDDDDESINKIKIGNFFINDDNQVKNNYNYNQSSSPLSKLLKYSDLKFDHFINAKDFEKKDIDKTQQQQSNDKSTKFKFPLGFIFSKNNKEEKEIENRICDADTTKRKDSLSNILN
ncbi:MAG TPA: hypothetical protein VFM28_11960 [Nitrososphaeraceae archaeon]|nr:hypothetical protein [Nitrososphaeraceae archaeon]